MSRHLDSIYNGIVYKKHAILDSPNFQVDEKVFADICDSISDPNSPYDFNSIPINILGSIYERFLGKVIVTKAKTASVEEKEEVRKAGGVYYTPEYIVRYIVENTIGKLVEGKTPDTIANLKFADIACGSGSFLIGVYDYVLRYHETYYNNNRKSAKKGDCVEQNGFLILTLKKKRQILLSNIFGVDIDHQAVEVAQLSLYLKLLEDETIASAKNYQHEIHQAILPPLTNNIVCGNSLVELDVLDGDLFDDTHQRELNPLNFKERFPKIFDNGGFDAIVGNPPYVRPHRMPQATKEYLWKTLATFRAKSDMYSCFMERSLDLIKEGAKLSFIVPIHGYHSKAFRKLESAFTKLQLQLKTARIS